jgi:hypothetical protein
MGIRRPTKCLAGERFGLDAYDAPRSAHDGITPVLLPVKPVRPDAGSGGALVVKRP